MTHAVLARRGALSGAILLAGCLLLAACSGGTHSSGTTSSGYARSAASSGGAIAEPAPAQAVNGAGFAQQSAASSEGQHAAVTAGLAPLSQGIVYTATMTVRSANVAAAARKITGIVVAAGGYTSDEHLMTGTPGKTGETVSVTLKIPVPAYQSVLAELSSPALGKQISMQQQATDVTQQVANVNSLVTSQEDAISALQGLLKRAASVPGLLQVQQQISFDESTLNSLLAQQRALDHETSYATVSMTLVSPVHKAVHKKAAQHGFLSGLSAGWRALRHATAWVLTALGAALPFLIVIVVLGGIGYGGWRRFGRRKGSPAAGPTPAGPTAS
jgi:Domain of unknown function (DUF4349)